MEITREHAKKVLEIVDCGLIRGGGRTAEPGKVCVEQVISMVIGGEFTDRPKCVHPSVSTFKRSLNDCLWSSNKARAKGLRKIAIAQLGSDGIDGEQFLKELQRLTIQRIIPIALRAAAKKNPKRADALEAAAVRCEQEPTVEVVREARNVAYAAADADAAYYAANAAAYADAAADAAAAYAYGADDEDRDRILTISADCALEALQICNSPGCQWLELCGDE